MKRTTKKAAGIAALGSAGVLGVALAMPSLADTDAPATVAVSAAADDSGESADPDTGADADADGRGPADADERGPADAGERGPGGHHGHGPHGGGPGMGLDVAAETLGLSAEELRTELQAGTTLGEVADAQGVDRQVLVDALLAEQEQRITELLDRSLPQRPDAPVPGEDGGADDSSTTEESSTTQTN